MKGSASRVDEPCDFVLAQYRRQANLLGVGSLGHAPRPLECLDEEKPQSSQVLGNAARRELSLAEQMGLILPDVLGPQPVRRTVEVAGKISDRADVAACGPRRVVATLEFFEHHLA